MYIGISLLVNIIYSYVACKELYIQICQNIKYYIIGQLFIGDAHIVGYTKNVKSFRKTKTQFILRVYKIIW